MTVICNTNTGVRYDSHMQHKYKCSKIERLLILVQLVFQWRTKGPKNPRGTCGPQTQRILKLVFFNVLHLSIFILVINQLDAQHFVFQ